MVEINKAIYRLNKYIKEDAFFTGQLEPKEIYEKEQLEHCKDIKILLNKLKSNDAQIYNLKKERTRSRKDLVNKIIKLCEKEI